MRGMRRSDGVRRWIVGGLCLSVLALAVSLSPAAQARTQQPLGATHAQPVGDWTTYVYDVGHSGYNGTETAINPSSAPGLKRAWTHGPTGGAIVTQPVVSGNLVFWGSWDGYEHATNLTNNAFVWARQLGTTTNPCGSILSPFGPLRGPLVTGSKLGVTATATVTTIGSTPMLFVAGGARQVFALNPANGATIWQQTVTSNPAAFLWASPVVFNGNVYIAVASISDCPLVAGQIVELSGATGAVLHTFTTVPSGCIGAGVWGTPTIDATAGTLYFTTGNPGSCKTSEPYGESIVELRAADLSFVHHWQVPASQQTGDGDFGATPTLFTATINGTLHQLVGASNKNGIFYAWDRADINSELVWQTRLAVGGACPECGQGSIAPAAWDGSRLYVAGGNTTIGGHGCKGSVRALNPASGATIWAHCMQSGPVLGPVTAVPGVVVAAEANWLIVMDAATGPTLYRFPVADGQSFFSGASISNGQLYIGNLDGNLFAFKP